MCSVRLEASPQVLCMIVPFGFRGVFITCDPWTIGELDWATRFLFVFDFALAASFSLGNDTRGKCQIRSLSAIIKEYIKFMMGFSSRGFGRSFLLYLYCCLAISTCRSCAALAAIASRFILFRIAAFRRTCLETARVFAHNATREQFPRSRMFVGGMANGSLKREVINFNRNRRFLL